MTAFDENAPHYRALCKRVHVRMAARGVAIACIFFIAVILIESFSRRTSTLLYTWASGSFAISIYAMLVYGTFREKRLFMLPFLCCEAAAIVIVGLMLVIFIGVAIFSKHSLKQFAIEASAYDEHALPAEQTSRKRGARACANAAAEHSARKNDALELRHFILVISIATGLTLALHAWFVEVIYRYFQFLKLRETSFAFHAENDFQMTD